jgi:DNA-binding transcriptional LysR family regulator
VLIRIAVPHSVAEGLLPAVLKGFLVAHPDASVEVLAGTYATIERWVGSGEADLGFVALPTSFPGLAVERVARVASVAVLPRGHALARRKAIAAGDLVGTPLVMIGRQQTTRLQVERAFRKAGVIPEVKVETHTVASACALVAAGLGVSLVNGLMAEGVRHLGFVIRPFVPALEQEFGLAFRAGRAQARLTDALAARLAARVRRLSRPRWASG